MIKVKIKEVLDKQDKSLYWLAQDSELSYPTIHNLASGKTESINFKTLERICLSLNVDIADILEIVPDTEL